MLKYWLLIDFSMAKGEVIWAEIANFQPFKA